MSKTKIEWTEVTWNPITGCTKVSEGCRHCYAETMSNRLKAMGTPKYTNGFRLSLHEEALCEPFQWKQPTTVFVCSMSDIFHENVPFSFIDRIMNVIEQTPQHKYQILTKRVERMADYFSSKDIPPNIWTGVTVENADVKGRIDILRSIQSPLRFLSCEPLLGDLGILNLEKIGWVIVGGESGVQARPMKKVWVENLWNQCQAKNVPFFFKQWGTWGEDGQKRNKKENGNLLNGVIVQSIPNLD